MIEYILDCLFQFVKRSFLSNAPFVSFIYTDNEMGGFLTHSLFANALSGNLFLLCACVQMCYN